MFAHFKVAYVWISYFVIFVLTAILPGPYIFKLLIFSFFALEVDRMTHQDNHPNEKIATPIPLYAWWFGLLVVGWLVPLVSFWQVIGLLCCQAVWDLSWHAITYHRSFDEGYAQADQEWIRTCTLLAAFLIFFCPHVDTTDVSVILSFIEVPRVWHWWWYGPIVC